MEYSNRFSEILAVWDEICHTVPEEWWFFDDEKTIPTDIQRNEMYQQLTYYQNINFWEQI
nr:HipA family kinase [Bathymodiolus heckerae thiotrophic gill symbiont]